MKRPMTCRNGVSLLADYLEGVLAPGPRIALDTHVAGCPRCRRFVRSYVKTPALVREATAVSLPSRVAAALRRRLSGRRS